MQIAGTLTVHPPARPTAGQEGALAAEADAQGTEAGASFEKLFVERQDESWTGQRGVSAEAAAAAVVPNLAPRTEPLRSAPRGLDVDPVSEAAPFGQPPAGASADEDRARSFTPTGPGLAGPWPYPARHDGDVAALSGPATGPAPEALPSRPARPSASLATQVPTTGPVAPGMSLPGVASRPATLPDTTDAAAANFGGAGVIPNADPTPDVVPRRSDRSAPDRPTLNAPARTDAGQSVDAPPHAPPEAASAPAPRMTSVAVTEAAGETGLPHARASGTGLVLSRAVGLGIAHADAPSDPALPREVAPPAASLSALPVIDGAPVADPREVRPTGISAPERLAPLTPAVPELPAGTMASAAGSATAVLFAIPDDPAPGVTISAEAPVAGTPRSPTSAERHFRATVIPVEFWAGTSVGPSAARTDAPPTEPQREPKTASPSAVTAVASSDDAVADLPDVQVPVQTAGPGIAPDRDRQDGSPPPPPAPATAVPQVAPGPTLGPAASAPRPWQASSTPDRGADDDGDPALALVAPDGPASAPAGAELRLAPGTGGPSGEAAARADLGARVAQQLSVALSSQSDGRIDLALDPAELGRVRLHLSPGDGGIAVQIVAERPETLDLLRRHADLLAADLRAAGYGTIAFQFGTDTPSHSGRRAAGLDLRTDAVQAEPSGMDPGSHPLTVRPSSGRSGTGLDLRL